MSYEQGILAPSHSEPKISTTSPALPKYNRLDPSNPGVTIQFYDDDDDDNNASRLAVQKKQPSYQEVTVTEACKLVREELIVGTQHLRCHLFRLPIEVRFKIYEALFVADSRPLEIDHTVQCRHISSDDSPDHYPAAVTNHWRRSYGSVMFLIGATNFDIALQRRWEFSEFITTLRMAEPLEIYSLTVVATDNWKLPGFNELDLVNALFSGAIKYLRTLVLKGFTAEERDRLCELAHARGIPTLRIMRNKKKIQGAKFSIWVYLDALKYEVYDSKENVAISFCGVQA
ncbi:hypothetical protein FE257_001655 [Aspergillus nanangensis]|uniref:Uncharacterized protein n=1 Tax=Aspergillus nanangensis TaxID=2582783 RepID=A0AAD4CTQ2_ASPNN|nr:hypothetical protein FE257_001655 [Aspergillus nanangensis]